MRRPVAPGANITFAGTDIGRGETVLRRGDCSPRAKPACWRPWAWREVPVVRRPRVAILSTGDEMIPPGAPMRPGLVYDSNATILADAVRELGGEPVPFGIVPDDRARLERHCAGRWPATSSCSPAARPRGPATCRIAWSASWASRASSPTASRSSPASRSAWPRCAQRTDAAGAGRRSCPAFPTSAIFTFHEFVAPVIRRLAGRPEDADDCRAGPLPLRVNSERGRTEYLLVGLVQARARRRSGTSAYPMGKGSGSVTTFSRADGFVIIPRQREYLEAGDVVDVHLLGQGLRPADLVVIGSHCVGLDYLLGRLQERGRAQQVPGGRQHRRPGRRRGAASATWPASICSTRRPTPTTGPSSATTCCCSPATAGCRASSSARAIARFEGRTVVEAVPSALADPQCVLVNRNRGSGTRILIDRLLGQRTAAGLPDRGALAQCRGRGRGAGPGRLGRRHRHRRRGMPAWASCRCRQEQYDFVVPKGRWNRPAVGAFRDLLARDETRTALAAMGFMPDK